MRKRQRRYVLDIVLGTARFGRRADGREVLRFATEHVFLPFCSLPNNAVRNARRRFLKFKAKDGAYDLIDIRLFTERRVRYERLIR